MTTPKDIVKALDLRPHPEGGWYRETWRAATPDADRSSGTAIYYLLEHGQISRWHRVDAAEIWHWYGGAALELRFSQDGITSESVMLGPDIATGQRPQLLVPVMCWQSARSTGAYTLVGCTVSPGFEFDGFEMAPEGWEPGK